MLIDRKDVPKHLFGIPELDLSGDLCAEPLSGQWFRLGAWTFGSGSANQVWWLIDVRLTDRTGKRARFFANSAKFARSHAWNRRRQPVKLGEARNARAGGFCSR
ncbi:MAG: hypothetical protein JO232_23250 [Verrucomicrobia bacterium]|nr:hypothetical protein [Verrucomicrobiota bacterium]